MILILLLLLSCIKSNDLIINYKGVYSKDKLDIYLGRFINYNEDTNKDFKKEYALTNCFYLNKSDEEIKELFKDFLEIKEDLLSKDFDKYINGYDENGFAPIHVAIIYKRYEILKFLLSSECKELNIYLDNRTKNENLTPFSLAIIVNDIPSDLLLQLIPNSLNSLDINKISALGYACLSNNLKIVKYLIEKAEYKVQDNEVNPLLLARFRKNKDIVDYLRSTGLKEKTLSKDKKDQLINMISFKNSDDLESFFDSLKSPDIKNDYLFSISTDDTNLAEIENYIKSGLNLDIKDSNGNTPLHLALKSKAYKIALLLITNISNIDTYSNLNNITPLHLISEIGNEKLLLELLNKWKSNNFINQKTNKGVTALQTLARKGFSNLLSILLDCDVDINEKDKKGETALHKAAKNDKVNCIKILLKKEADPNASNNEKKTPLHYASSNNNIIAIQLLLDKGADIYAEDIRHMRPIDIVENKEALNLMINHFLEEINPDKNKQSVDKKLKLSARDIENLKELCSKLWKNYDDLENIISNSSEEVKEKVQKETAYEKVKLWFDEDQEEIETFKKRLDNLQLSIEQISNSKGDKSNSTKQLEAQIKDLANNFLKAKKDIKDIKIYLGR